MTTAKIEDFGGAGDGVTDNTPALNAAIAALVHKLEFGPGEYVFNSQPNPITNGMILEGLVLLIAEGNHDIAGSVWLRAMFQALYEAEPRVTVIDSELPFYAYQHGSTMLCWHHGHLKKNDALPLMMASQFSEMWGATKKRYCHTGDKHHVDEKEHSGMIVCQHPTLAARDAYASRHGWHALRSANCITYHRQHGEVARVKVCPEMLEAAE